MVVYFFPRRLTNVSALHGETRPRKLRLFYLNTVYCVTTKDSKQLKAHSDYHMVTADLHSFVKQSTVYNKQNLGRQHSVIPGQSSVPSVTTHSLFAILFLYTHHYFSVLPLTNKRI